MSCNDFEQDLILDLYGELPPERNAAYQAHVAGCAHCQAAREEIRSLHGVLAERPLPEPAPEMLVECRQALAEALARDRLDWSGLLRAWLPSRAPARLDARPPRLRLAPSLSLALSLVVFGFGLGWALRPRAAGLLPPGTAGLATSSMAGDDLENMRINDISRVAPDPKTGDVHITMDAQRHVTLEGSLDDPHIQQFLVNAMKSYDNPGIRRETLNALRARAESPQVRAALLYTMEHDSNVGNRLAALAAARGMEDGEDLQRSLLEVLEHDSNMGVRVESVDALVDHVGKAGREAAIASTLQRLAAGDASPYVRLKCSSALLKVGSEGFLQGDAK
jgi:hypothetical protein